MSGYHHYAGSVRVVCVCERGGEIEELCAYCLMS